MHEDSGRYLVHRLKFHHGLREGRVLSAILGEEIEQAYHHEALPQCLIPVPLSWWNQVKRGYNQATVITQHLANTLKIPLKQPFRRKNGPSQRTLKRTQRQQLKADHFRLFKSLEHTHVAIIDDVLTTGSTVKAMANILAANGVETVDVWCATRALLD
ncbi:MAG: ComF family protein [Gammaproteobacteria bacterium]|nr:ComF family protein [Gammaproteobacteria bacterium]